MPKQIGIKIIGTFHDITFYRVKDNFLVKNKSSLNAKRIKKDPSFRVFRERSAQFAEAAQIASRIYRLYPKGKRKSGVFQKICAKVYKHLLEGKTEQEIRQLIK
jgi:hypothetical protein